MRAAQYVRMSTERQEYSIENQLAAIQTYALAHGFEIVKTFSDPGRSGMDLARRPGLRSLLEEVVTMQSDFGAVLVYDVSRWGRFLDVMKVLTTSSCARKHTCECITAPNRLPTMKA